MSNSSESEVPANQNLVVNLEDLVKEEAIIYKVVDAINRKKVVSPTTCQRWWKLTDSSSVRQMESFFEEAHSKKLTRQYQLLVSLAFGFIESMTPAEYSNSKIYTSIKNVMRGLHRNYLVFVEFIHKNLTPQQ